MSKSHATSPSRVFLAALTESARAALSQETDLEPWLVATLSAAEAAWPELASGRDQRTEPFVRYLAAKISSLESPSSFQKIRATDLYLTCACVEKEPRAFTLLEARYFPQVDRALGRMKIAPSLTEELKGQLREKLFFAAPGARPLVADYSGRGDLGSWVRSVAVRAGLKIARKEQKNVEIDDALEMQVSGGNVELDYLKKLYATEFKTALAVALQTLEDRERNLLRQHYLDGLNIDAIGKLHRVHRATAARWIADVRESLLGSVRTVLAKRLSLSKGELDSILGMGRSGLDMSISRLLPPK